MRLFFLVAFLCLVLLSVIAWLIQPADSREGVTRIVWVTDDNPVRRAQVELFNSMHPDVEVVLDPGNRDVQKVIVQSLAGVGPDLFDAFDGSALSAYVRSGVAWDVTEEFRRLGIDLRRNVWKALLPKVIFEGRCYGFPTNGAVNAVWFNKKIFDEANVPYPHGKWTWADLIALGKKLTVRDSQGRPVRFGFIFDWWNWQFFVLQFGGRVFTDDGTECIVDREHAVAAIQFMYDLTYKYGVSPTPLDEAGMSSQGGWGAGTIAWFGAGRAAMALGGRWWLCTLRQYPGLRLGAIEAPYARVRAYTTSGRGTIINAQSKHKVEALAFLRFMASREYNELVNRQADGVAPVVAYCYTDEFEYNPNYPGEDFNAVWRDAMHFAVSEEVSPFVGGAIVARIIYDQIDLVKARQKDPATAMRTAARQINAEIKRNVLRNPELAKKYVALRGRLP
ncbi:MAG: ABC transporter substrate-binding protein [Fimbriimonadales bacterium]